MSVRICGQLSIHTSFFFYIVNKEGKTDITHHTPHTTIRIRARRGGGVWGVGGGKNAHSAKITQVTTNPLAPMRAINC